MNKVLVISIKSLVFASGLTHLIEKNIESVTINKVLDLSNLNDANIDILIFEFVNYNLKENLQQVDQLKKKYPNTKLILLCKFPEVILLKKIVKQGLNGLLHWYFEDDQIINTIKNVLNEENTPNYGILENIKTTISINSMEAGLSECKLTKKGFEILANITAGKSNKVIASDLKITERTVEFHKTNIYRKTNSQSVVDLINFSIAISFL